MTDSMNFGPEWIRNMPSEGGALPNTGGGTVVTKYQLADYRYGREEMLALFDRNIKPPACLTNFKSLYSDTTLLPLALLPVTDEERGWQTRPTNLTLHTRGGRGAGTLERGGRIGRGRGAYPTYGRPPNYEAGWGGNGEPSDWSPRKEYQRTNSMDNWRRARTEEDDGWRGKGRQSWRGSDGEERPAWERPVRKPGSDKSVWDTEDHLPEWAMDNPGEGGSFDDRGAFHGSDDEPDRKLQKSVSQTTITPKMPPLTTSKSSIQLKDPLPREESPPIHEKPPTPKPEENDFEKLQEDFVSKLVVDEEPKVPFELPPMAPPPNLPVAGQDKWFYQDPQGQMQGPFTNVEMSEWCKAGYFGKDLKVRRQCDERFFLLGELSMMSGHTNPFQERYPLLKNDISKMPENDMQFQLLSQLTAYKQAQARVLADPWSALAVQQQELAAQRLIIQQQQVQQELSFMQAPPPANPLMHMINQMQQANKLDKPPNMPSAAPLDPHIQLQMTNFLSMQNRLSNGHPQENFGIGTGSVLIPGLMNVARDNEGDAISSLLKQLQHHKQHEAMWQQNQQFQNNGQWQQPEVPLSMWEEKSEEPDKKKEKKEEEKEMKKKKKMEEELLKKEQEEKRKQEQRKLEHEKKVEAERRKKEEDRVKKELEKARKEAEEKRQRELEEKRRQKEQRKLEEEARKRSEEERKKIEEEKKLEREMREREEKQRQEEKRQEIISKAAPWSQSNSTFGTSLADIQKAEKERKVQEMAIQAQRAHIEKEMQMQQQQQQLEKIGPQLGWAKKAMEPRKVKSLAEIQAEEQERLLKEVAEARQKKEKELRETPQISQNSIWSGQSLNWAATSQWSSSSGFWEEPTNQKHQNQPKPSTAVKNAANSASNKVQPTKQAMPQKPKPKPEQPSQNNKKHNNNVDDDFTGWCHKTLVNMVTTNSATEVDIPTFVTFLKDIESAFEVREYCKEYLGEGSATNQFANNFLEKRRSFKPKHAHKDDMCIPAPAITPSMQHSSEFQEVKGKNKKAKKSKMLKVDSRILGFNVTSAPDRINVGDRDYGDNS